MASVALSLAYWHSLAMVLVGTVDTTSRETFQLSISLMTTMMILHQSGPHIVLCVIRTLFFPKRIPRICPLFVAKRVTANPLPPRA